MATPVRSKETVKQRGYKIYSKHLFGQRTISLTLAFIQLTWKQFSSCSASVFHIKHARHFQILSDTKFTYLYLLRLTYIYATSTT